MGYGLDDRGSIPGRGIDEILSLRHRVKTGSGAHQASPMGTGSSYLEVKRSRRESDHSLPSSAKVKNARSCTSTPQYVFMAWPLSVLHRPAMNPLSLLTERQMTGIQKNQRKVCSIASVGNVTLSGAIDI